MDNQTPMAELIAKIVAVDAPVRFKAYDGSSHGPVDAEVTVDIRSPLAWNHMVSAPGELGLARAYVSGEIDLHGDTYTALRHLSNHQLGALSWAERLSLLRTLGPRVLKPVDPPPQEVAPTWRDGLRHSVRRDSRAISHHYDVSNRFYEWVLGPSMAYTCSVFPHADATLEDAQAEKFDLVCRKLDLRPGQRLLDVGCGWGGMVMHAARNYGVRALGVTLSRQQAEWAQKAISDAGLAEVAEVRHLDYRKVTESGFDAISSIGLTEHIGGKELQNYAGFLYGKLRPEGRLLNHCITRANDDSPLIRRRGFINRYVFPDGELVGVGRLAATLQRAGFEVRHEENLREHYAMTLREWCANLSDHWDEAVDEVGLGTARVWMLYMAGSRLAFDRNEIQLHQILCVRPAPGGSSAMPLRPTWLS